MPLTQMFYAYLLASDIVVSPSRDQNYRKYFEMRKKYNIQEEWFKIEHKYNNKNISFNKMD